MRNIDKVRRAVLEAMVSNAPKQAEAISIAEVVLMLLQVVGDLDAFGPAIEMLGLEKSYVCVVTSVVALCARTTAEEIDAAADKLSSNTKDISDEQAKRLIMMAEQLKNRQRPASSNMN